ncbi:MAG: hypothetical protein ACJAS4_002984 [Bacteriovoracaceae bacterium]
MLKLFSLFIFIGFSNSAISSGITLKDAPTAENRIKLSRKDVDINITKFGDQEIKAIVDNSSFEWVRFDETLLLPKVRLKIKVNSPDSDFVINYKGSSISFQQSKKNSYAELYFSLFERDEVQILNKDGKVANITITLNNKKAQRVIIDYTCSRNNIEIEGLEDEHFSIGCRTRRIGAYGKEKAMLEVQWVSPELKIVNGDYIPNYAAFLNKLPVKIKVQNVKTLKEKEITIKAKVPKRLHRLFTAYGFGPYSLHTKTVDSDKKVLTKRAPVASALFFYLNYKISDTSSIRGFNAAVLGESKFNNAAMYLGSDFAFSLDNKLYFTTLLGVQYLYFKFDDETPEVSEPIFPQGIEFMYRHAFNIPNYIVSGGVFLSTSDKIDYENIWVRWGKNYFWELNIITWGKDDFEARTWGVSVGIPFKGFL